MKIFETLSRRGLALFLVLTMCLSLLPATALADELEGGSELTGGDVQTDDAADLTTTDEATGENAGETTDAATPGETGDETGSGDAALNGDEAQDGSEKAEEKQESPEAEETSNAGISLFSMDSGFAPLGETKGYYEIIADGNSTIDVEGTNYGSYHVWSVFEGDASCVSFYDNGTSVIKVAGIRNGTVKLLHTYGVAPSFDEYGAPIDVADIREEIIEIKVVVPQEVYVYIHVDGDKNKTEGTQNELGWYTIGKIMVPGLPNPDTAYEDKDGSSPSVRYGQHKNAILSALEKIEYYADNEHFSEELDKVDWTAAPTVDDAADYPGYGLRAPNGANDYSIPTNQPAWHLDGLLIRTYTVTIVCKDEDGKVLETKKLEQEFKNGDEFDAKVPTIAGYTPDSAVYGENIDAELDKDGYIKGTVNGDVTVTVTYKNVPVEKIPVTIKVKDRTLPYNGKVQDGEPFEQTEFVNPSEELKATGLTPNQIILEGYKSAEGKDVNTDKGYYVGDATGVTIKSATGEDLSSKYEIIVLPGKLTVTPLPVTFKSESAEKEFDGTALVKHAAKVVKGELASDYNNVKETPKFVFTGSQIGIDSSENLFTAEKSTTFNPANYNISYEYGTLTVKPQAQYTYTVHYCIEGKKTDGDLMTEQETVVKGGAPTNAAKYDSDTLNVGGIHYVKTSQEGNLYVTNMTEDVDVYLYYLPDMHGNDEDPLNKPDDIPDDWQVRVEFKVDNGYWNNTDKNADTKICYVTNRDASGNPKPFGEAGTAAKLKAEQIPNVGHNPAEHYRADGAWSADLLAVEFTKDDDNRSYTYTYAPDWMNVTVKYVDDSTPVRTLDQYVTGEKDLKYGEKYDVTARILDELTVDGVHYILETAKDDVKATGTLTDNVVITLVYTRDTLVDPTVPEGNRPENGGDGIPDKYQAVVSYEAVNGTVSISDTVVTLYKDGNPAIDGVGHLTAGQIPTATANAGYNQASAHWDTEPTTATEITGNVTYTVTFTANPVPTHTVTINYVYEGGTLAAPSASRTLAEGAVYSIGSPAIDGYTADRTTVTGTMGTGDVTVTVTYRPVPPIEYDLVINYVYADGTTAAPSHTETIVSGGSFSVTSPVIGGFTADQIVVSGSMTGDRTITVIYTPAGGGGTPVTPVTPVTPNAPASTIPDGPTPTAPGGVTIGDEDTPLAAPGLNSTDHFDYIKGYGDGTVRPEANIKRSEVATIFFRLMTNEFRTENWATENDFTDVKAGDWYNNAISTAAKAGILNGYEDGSFQPNRDITRAEFAAIAARFASDVVPSGGMFSDIEGHWAQESIERASAAGWIRGSDGKFRPNDKITRAEAITLINRMLDRVPDADHLLPDMITFSDNTPDKWYYADVQEATNSHDYERAEDGVTGIWTQLLPECDWTALEKEWATAASAPSTNLMGGQQGSEGEGEAKPEETTGGNGGSKPEETTGGEDDAQDETTGSGEE